MTVNIHWLLDTEIEKTDWNLWPKSNPTVGILPELIPPTIPEMIGWVMGLQIITGYMLLFVCKDQKSKQQM